MKHVAPARFSRNALQRPLDSIFDGSEPRHADRAARTFSRQFGLPLSHARLVVELTGIAKGGRHA